MVVSPSLTTQTRTCLLIILCWFGVTVKSNAHYGDYYGTYCVWGGWDDIDMDDESYPYDLNNGHKDTSYSISPSNVYDTYSADECRRVRRPWNALNAEERSIYIDGLLELRVRGQLDMNLDDLVAVASVHDDLFGSVTHHDSDYLFWHSYLVWELESRIRNLGGKYKCFGMPYWDWTNEYDRDADEEPYIFQTGLGGYGDPDDFWKVNGYSWDITTSQYWSPLEKDVNCSAKGDECPICSLKRSGENTHDFKGSNMRNAQQNGAAILNNPNFKDFQEWIVTKCGLPHCIDNSYDPIWYMFHSMESYYQAMWVNINDYDEIEDGELYKYPQAFSSYCNTNTDNITVHKCVGIGLDDPLFFGGVLAKRPWSFIHDQELSIKKLYYLPKWNIIYDLNGDDFFVKSGLKEAYEDKLNPEWFILPTEDDESIKSQETIDMVNSFTFIMESISLNHSSLIVVAGFICFGVLVLWAFCQQKSKKMYDSTYADYGSISLSIK